MEKIKMVTPLVEMDGDEMTSAFLLTAPVLLRIPLATRP